MAERADVFSSDDAGSVVELSDLGHFVYCSLYILHRAMKEGCIKLLFESTEVEAISFDCISASDNLISESNIRNLSNGRSHRSQQ